MPEKNIHIFLGSNEFDMQKRVSEFLAAFKDPAAVSMNVSRMDAQTASPGELANTAGAMPFLSPQRLIILENVGKRYKLRSGPKGQPSESESGDQPSENDASDEKPSDDRQDQQADRNSVEPKPSEDRKKFLGFLDKVPEFTQLLILETAEIKTKDIPSHWLVKWALKNPSRAEFVPFLPPANMQDWIVKETRRQGGAIEPAAAGELANMTGFDTRQASNEITKLLTYVNYSHKIGLEDVGAVSISTVSTSIFDLVDAMGRQDGKNSQRLYHKILEEKDAFELFGMIIRQFRLLIMARDMLESGQNAREAPELMGIHPYVAGKVFEQAAKFPMEKLKAVFHRLLLMDEAAKTGVMPLEVALDLFIVELSR